jgi:PAS domain S-box-containing protein
VISELITAILLFGQFGILRTPGLLVLACAYFFSALMAVVHMLTFPGLFAPSGLLGAGPQSTAWLYMLWHGGFPLLVIAYALMPNGHEGAASDATRAVPVGIALVAAAVLGCALLTTSGQDLLPAIMQGNRYTPAMLAVVSTVWTLSVVALMVQWRHRQRSVLDLWLAVVMCAWIFDIALSALLNAGRYDVGFYAGRVYGLLAATFVLAVLLLENGVLYARLARALRGEQIERRRVQEKTAELNELNARLEGRVAARTTELETVNRDLQQEVAQRARAEADSLEARQRLAGIIESAMDAIITVDENQNIVLFNAAAEWIFGCPRAEALGQPLAQFIPERFRTAHVEHMKRFGATATMSRRMSVLRVVAALRRNGEEFPIDASISHVTVHGGVYYTVILRDVTERVRADEALRRSREELHEIATVTSTAREQEKARIARELHDELAQALTALKMDVDALAESAAAADEDVAARIAAMREVLDGAVASTRRIAADLRPLMLDDLGLVPAIEWLVAGFTQRHGTPCELHVDPAQLELGDPYATAIFRIIQESLANVARHAQATRVRVELTRTDGRIHLQVRDNGRGFDPTRPRKPTSFGLVGLRERAHLVAGRLTIESAPGQGTVVDVSIPLPPA